MKTVRILALLAWLTTMPAVGQTSFFNEGFLRQPSAAADRAYLGISGGTGNGTVTNFAIGNLSPLFTAGVVNPTTFPTVTFTPIGQAGNLFYASPDGVIGFPSFRSLVSGDLPDITAIVRGDVSATAPILYNSGTGVFSMHVADSTHDGYLSALDWIMFNGKGVGTVVSITNSGIPAANNTLIASSNAPIPGIKSVSSSGSVSIVDQGGTNLLFSASTSSAGTDITMNDLTAYANGTNFNIDFNFAASTIRSTGDIAFNYSTNWGLSSTSRVCNVYIPATNILRHILFISLATNWHNNARTIVAVPTGYGAKLQMQLFGQGDTNVAYTPSIDIFPVTTNWIAAGGFNPTNSQGGCVAWWEASQQVYQDEFALTPIIDGVGVRAWVDLANVAGKATNGSSSIFSYYRNPNTSPGNIPSINFVPSGPAYLVTTNFTNIPQVNWAFIMFYGRGNSLIFLDGLSEGNRFACQVSETPSVPMAVYSGTSLLSTPGPGQIQWRLFAFCQNGALSSIRTNGVVAATGNSGAQTPARWTIAADYNLGTAVGNCNAAEILIYHTNLSLVQVTNVENYFRRKYGTW